MSQRPTINRVQPDYMDKNDLIPVEYGLLTSGTTPETLSSSLLAKEPVFYTQQTMISKPTTTGFTGLTSYSESDKVRFEVTEDFLIARQSYEFIKGAPSASNGIGLNPEQAGSVVGAFKISSHFDIRRDYNTTTGEELNVLVENSTDRPWYQRQFMRVDWSQNMVTGYNSVIAEQDYTTTVQSEPVPVFINSPNDPNAPVFVFSNPDDPTSRRLEYFDIVNRAVLHPETLSIPFTDYNIPMCWLGEGEQDCAPAEVAFRLAFRRVDTTRDYEPASLTTPYASDVDGAIQIPHLDMERFGFFDRMRLGYDPVQHTILDDERIHFATRHNIWLHHHAQALGMDTGTMCNADADCGDANQVCHIGNKLADSGHRGFCAPLAVAHTSNEIACTTNDDCLQTITGSGVSNTSFCDAGTCAENYFRCTTDTDCQKAVDPLSTCDLAISYVRNDNRGLCLLPFRQRQIRQIAYHESPNYPDYMQPVTEQIAKEWNDAFVTAITAARRHECELTAQADPSSYATLKDNPCHTPAVEGLPATPGDPTADAQFIYVACHSPVWGTADGPGNMPAAKVAAANAKGWDLPVCGPQGTISRLGDLRYSMIGAITDNDVQGYWGLANIAADPETGEMIVGRGAVWQTITDTYASYLTNLVQVINGDLDPTAISNGQYIVDAMKQFGTGATPSDAALDAPFRAEHSLQQISNGTKTGLARTKLPDSGWLRPGMKLNSTDINHPGALTTGMQRLLDSRVLGDGTARGTQQLLSLKGTELENMMMNADQIQIAATASPDPTGTLPETVNLASPMRKQSIAVRRVLSNLQNTYNTFQCNFEAPFTDEMLLGLAQRLAKGAPILQSNPDDNAVSFGRDWNFQNSDGTVNYNLMTQYAAQFIHHGVLAHELGHSLGQRHNFTASADAINYHDNYWKVRGQGHNLGLAPRYEYLADPKDGNYYSQNEIDGRVDEWAYSSVMDYKGLNEDAHGIGRYDYAFIKNGYVNMVEAFKNVADMDAAVVYSGNVAGNGFTTPLDLRDWQRGGAPHGMHYTQIPTIFGANPDGTPNIGTDNRYDVFLNETANMDVAGFGPANFTNVTVDGHLLVPYRFDTDERAGLVWIDEKYDAGGDAFEALHYSTQRWLDYYFANSYARLRTGFRIDHYKDRMQGRYLDQILQATQTLAFDLVNYQDFLSQSPGWLAYLNDPKEHAGVVNQATMSLSADALVNMLLMPEMGGHANVQQFDGSPLITPSEFLNAPVNIAINDGRAFESNWRNDVGFWWYEQLNAAGAYYDKTMAIDTLTYPDLNLLQRDTPTDIRLFELSFYTMFPDQITRLFGGILAEDNLDFAPIIASTTTDTPITRTHLATLNLPPGTGMGKSGRVVGGSHLPLDPQDHFTIQLYSVVNTMSQFPATYDQRYIDFTRLWADGGVEAIDVANPDVNTVSFTDPWSGTTYRALHIGAQPGEGGETVGASPYIHPETGKVANETGVAARMILHIRDMDFLRLKAQAKGQTTTEAALELQEHKYLDLINVMRKSTKWNGTGFAALP